MADPTTPDFDPDLVRRYDASGPRYTSYPTAPQFDDRFGEADLVRHAGASNAVSPRRPMSLYLHVPFCTSPCFYCGCNRVITRDVGRGARYVAELVREIRRAAPLFETAREVVQVHFGGGTPNFLSPALIGRLFDELTDGFRFSQAPTRDFSIEIDPRTVTPDDIGALAALGFNRASLGIQDFDPVVQQAVNRIQGVRETIGIIDACRDAGMRSVNVDLIYGLPKQTLDGFGATLDTVIDARPDRLAIYGYAHLPTMFKAQKQIRETDLPDAGGRLALLTLAVHRLTEAGYRYIGMDHFALPGDELARAQDDGSLQRNFMGYTTHADSDLVGLGVSAISHVGASFSQNARDIAGWQAALDRGGLPLVRGLELDCDDLVRAAIIQQLMCQARIDIGAVEARFDIDFADCFAASLDRLDRLERDGLVTVSDDAITATPHGRYLLRIIAMAFDAYLHERRPAASGARYSKAI